MCMSVQCVHGTQGTQEESGNEAMSTAYLFIFVLSVNVTKEQKCLSLASELQVGQHIIFSIDILTT